MLAPMQTLMVACMCPREIVLTFVLLSCLHSLRLLLFFFLFSFDDFQVAMDLDADEARSSKRQLKGMSASSQQLKDLAFSASHDGSSSGCASPAFTRTPPHSLTSSRKITAVADTVAQDKGTNPVESSDSGRAVCNSCGYASARQAFSCERCKANLCTSSDSSRTRTSKLNATILATKPVA